jgi:hypothetical protein
MFNQVTHRPEMVYAINEKLHNETEGVLKTIETSKNWTLDKRKYENWQIKAAYLGGAVALGLGARLALNSMIPVFDYLNPFIGYHHPAEPIPFPVVGTFSGAFMVGLLVSEPERRRVTQLSNRLNQLVVKHKLDTNRLSKNLAEKLEIIVKTANAYTKSRTLSEYCLTATLLATGLAGSLPDYLPQSLSPIVFAAGLAGTAAISLHHHMYKRQDLQRVSQNVNDCLKILEQQKEKIAA